MRFPAWRVWADSRVRLDDALLDSFAAFDLAVVALNLRASDESDVVPDLFNGSELPHGGGFRVTVALARERLAAARTATALNSFPVYLAGFDALLGAVIAMLRRLGLDVTKAGDVDTGISDKVKHLSDHAGINLAPGSAAMYELLIAIRHSVIHNGGETERVNRAWSQCVKADVDGSWTAAAGRPLAIGTKLKVDDRDAVALQHNLDVVAIDLSSKLRDRIDPVSWGRLVAAERDRTHRPVLNDPSRNVAKLVSWAQRDWNVELTADDAKAALKSPL